MAGEGRGGQEGQVVTLKTTEVCIEHIWLRTGMAAMASM